MLAITGILTAVVLIILLEVPPLLRANLRKECIAFGLLLGVGTALSILEALQVTVPNPFDWFLMIFMPFNLWLEQLLR